MVSEKWEEEFPLDWRRTLSAPRLGHYPACIGSEHREGLSRPLVPEVPLLMTVVASKDPDPIRSMLHAFSMIQSRIVPLIWHILLLQKENYFGRYAT
jgi:hypothetical protein